MKTLLTMAVAGAACMAGADTAHFDWLHGQNGTNDNAGIFDSIDASYDNVSNRFTWSATFSENGSGRIANGYTLAVSHGPNPKGHGGELALLYFDGRNMADPRLSVYAYNGQNANNSYADGDGTTGGAQAADFIGSSHGPSATSWINDLSMVQNVDGSVTMNVDIDATFIQTHDPLYGPDGDWTGVGFGFGDAFGQAAERIGLWFHSYSNLNAGYDNDGKITNWGGTQGWLDGSGLGTSTSTIPLPGAALMGVAGLGGIAVRRRR